MVWKRVRRLPPSPAPSRAKCGLPAAGSRCLRPPISKNQEKHCSSIGETAGATVAGCAALCCCLPCCLINLLLSFVFKLPAGLLKRALRRRRKRRAKIGIWKPKGVAFRDADDFRLRDEWLAASSGRCEVTRLPVQSPCPKIAQLDEEMLAMFRGAGFWRSHSQSEREHRPQS